MVSTTTTAPSARALTITVVPRVAYSMAFPARLEKTSARRSWSHVPVRSPFDLQLDGRVEFLDDVSQDLA
jgi:hypothetical protein